MLILLVEDNPDNRAIFSTMLEFCGHEVVAAETGMQGLDRAAEHVPDLILLDIELPDISGVTVRRRLRADERTTAIPVFAITAHSLSDDLGDTLTADFDQVIMKPIEPRVLVDTISKWESRAGNDAVTVELDA